MASFKDSFQSVRTGFKWVFYDSNFPYLWEVLKVSSRQVNIKKWEKGKLLFNQNKGYKFIIECLEKNLIESVI